MVSRSQGGKNMHLQKESIKSSFETEEDAFVMTPISRNLRPYRRESMNSRQNNDLLHDCLSPYFSYIISYISFFTYRLFWGYKYTYIILYFLSLYIHYFLLYIHNSQLMTVRETKEVPYFIQQHIHSLVDSLPLNPSQRHSILNRYQSHQGYQFLNPKSKLHPLFQHFFTQRFPSEANMESDSGSKLGATANLAHQKISIEQQHQIEEQVKVQMVGTLSDISVGGMCEVVKDYMRQECPAYFAAPNQSFLQEFAYTKDSELTDKVNQMVHSINLKIIEAKKPTKDKKTLRNESANSKETSNKNHEFLKQMTVSKDGSLGSWGGTKYEGLGSRDKFSNYRRQQSRNYYISIVHDKKK